MRAVIVDASSWWSCWVTFHRFVPFLVVCLCTNFTYVPVCSHVAGFVLKVRTMGADSEHLDICSHASHGTTCCNHLRATGCFVATSTGHSWLRERAGCIRSVYWHTLSMLVGSRQTRVWCRFGQVGLLQHKVGGAERIWGIFGGFGYILVCAMAAHARRRSFQRIQCCAILWFGSVAGGWQAGEIVDGVRCFTF